MTLQNLKVAETSERNHYFLRCYHGVGNLVFEIRADGSVWFQSEGDLKAITEPGTEDAVQVRETMHKAFPECPIQEEWNPDRTGSYVAFCIFKQ